MTPHISHDSAFVRAAAYWMLRDLCRLLMGHVRVPLYAFCEDDGGTASMKAGHTMKLRIVTAQGAIPMSARSCLCNALDSLLSASNQN